MVQVRKLVQKVVTRDSLHYRKLTDKPRVKEEDSKDSDRTKDTTRDKVKEKDPAAAEALAALAFGVYCSLCFILHVYSFTLHSLYIFIPELFAEECNA